MKTSYHTSLFHFVGVADRTVILTNVTSSFNTISLINVYKVHLEVDENYMQVSLT